MKDFTVITFSTGEPYFTETLALEKLCNFLKIPFARYDLEWLEKTEFYSDNLELFSKKKCGYCAWKPYVILDALKKYKKVLYLDSSMLFNPENIEEYINKECTISSTVVYLFNKNYTKSKTFEIMNRSEDKYLNSYQAWAGTILASQKAKKFLEEWLYYCSIEECVSDVFSRENEPEVKYCLYDQSVYSILYKKYGFPFRNNIKENGTCYFMDAREGAHRRAIEKLFGKTVISIQDALIMFYMDNYISNGSCIYNPVAYAV